MIGERWTNEVSEPAPATGARSSQPHLERARPQRHQRVVTKLVVIAVWNARESRWWRSSGSACLMIFKGTISNSVYGLSG